LGFYSRVCKEKYDSEKQSDIAPVLDCAEDDLTALLSDRQGFALYFPAPNQFGSFMVGRAGPLATRNREPGQARKGAAAAVDAGAGMWLVRTATSF